MSQKRKSIDLKPGRGERQREQILDRIYGLKAKEGDLEALHKLQRMVPFSKLGPVDALDHALVEAEAAIVPKPKKRKQMPKKLAPGRVNAKDFIAGEAAGIKFCKKGHRKPKGGVNHAAVLAAKDARAQAWRDSTAAYKAGLNVKQRRAYDRSITRANSLHKARLARYRRELR